MPSTEERNAPASIVAPTIRLAVRADAAHIAAIYRPVVTDSSISAYVRADARRAGIGHALYASLLAVLVRQGFRDAYAGVTLPNDASVALHRAAGFTPVGVYRGVGYKLGAWHDVAWFERALAPRVAEPPEPVPLPALDPDAVREALAAGERPVRVS